MDNIYDINDYYKLLKLQEQYENGLIDEDELSLNEINDLIKLYKFQIKKTQEEIKIKMLHKNGQEDKR